MKHFLALMLALACMAAGLAHADDASHGLDYDMISLQADARAEVPNDLLVATLFVEKTMSDATKLAGEVNRTLNDGVRLVHEFPKVKIESGQQSTWPVYDPKTSKLTGWRTRAELRVESKDLDAAAKVIARLQATLQMGNLNFVLAPETATATSNRLIDSALKAFSTRADIIARSMGARGWRTVNLNVDTQGGQPQPMPYRAKATLMAADGIAPQDVAGGTSDIVVNVSGSIQLLR